MSDIFISYSRKDSQHALALAEQLRASGMGVWIDQLCDKPEALHTFRKAIEAGYRNIHNLKEFLTEEKEGVLALKGTPEWEAVREMVAALDEGNV